MYMQRLFQIIHKEMIVIFFLLIVTTAAGQRTMLLRQPSLSTQSIVFVHGDDLWVVGKDGGDARGLTSAIGTETSARIRPDGNAVAFTGQYDGNCDVYTVSIDGGEPKRLTWHPGGDIVQSWTPDG